MKKFAPRIRYLMFFDESGRYELAVIDRARGENFAIAFRIPYSGGLAFDWKKLRQHQHDHHERRLWMGVKEHSPGTYLDACELGYVPPLYGPDPISALAMRARIAHGSKR